MARQKQNRTTAPEAPAGKPDNATDTKPSVDSTDATPQPKTEAKPKAAKHPDSVTLSAPHGFIDDDGNHRYWHAGHVVTDPEHVALLIKRKAPLDGIDHDEA